MSASALARRTAPEGTVVPFPPTRPAPAQVILSVGFASPDGRTCEAIGGGDTFAEAVAFAHDSCPPDTIWQPVRWNDLYGV